MLNPTHDRRVVDKEEEPSTSCCAPSGTSPRPKPSSGLLSGVRADCRVKSRSTVIRPLHRAAKEALDEHPEGNQCKIRSSKYLNNLIEQDHRSVKLRLSPMLGLKSISAKPQRRSPASNSCIGSGRVSSNSVDWASKGNTGSQDLECGSRCVIQRNFPAPAWLDLKTFAPQPASEGRYRPNDSKR